MRRTLRRRKAFEIHSVRERLYRGYCAHSAEATAYAAELAGRRAELLGIFATVPGLDPRTQARATTYLDGFFSDLAVGKVLKNCVS